MPVTVEGPSPISERQLPRTVLTSVDLFGPGYWRIGETFKEAPDGVLKLFTTQDAFVRGKLMVFKDRILQYSTDTGYPDADYYEVDEQHVQFIVAPPPGTKLTASYILPGTIERNGWEFNEVPLAGEQPNGVRTDFSVRRPISSSLISVFAEGVSFLNPTDYSLPNNQCIRFVTAPATGTKLSWTYATI